MFACLLFSGFVSEHTSHFDSRYLLLTLQLTQLCTKKTQQPAFILEGKTPVESSREDAGGGQGRSLSPSPAALPPTQVENLGPWQSESLLAESWSTMGDVDPEDTKSLDSSDGAVLAGEENHSSNSDMVHLEREEAEMLEEAEKEAPKEERGRRPEEEEEEDEEMQMSVLGGERELAELREDEKDLKVPETKELLVSSEQPRVKREPAGFRQVVPPMALPLLPIVKLEPPSTTSTPLTTTSEVEELYSTQGLHPPSILAPMAAEPSVERLEQLKFSQIPLSETGEHSVKESQVVLEKKERTALKTVKPLSSTELLCGGAALVAVVGIVAYGAVAYCRK